mgnify:CR=1 FL=1
MIKKLLERFRKKDEDSPAFRRAMAQKLDGKIVKYATERDENGTETVIGREGHANIVNGDTFAVTCGIDTIFSCSIDEMSAWELLSLEGAVLTAYDRSVGRERSVVIYYKYYR